MGRTGENQEAIYLVLKRFLFKINLLFQEHYQGPDQDRCSVGPDLGPQTSCKGYQQTTKVTTSREKVKDLASRFQIYIMLNSTGH